MLLVMDTSGPHCSAALYDREANKIVVEMSDNLGRGHAERLMPMLEELLEKAGATWADIIRLGVVNGPGSFTGMRVALSTARGLALALEIPCNAVTVFEAMGEAFGIEEALCVAIDAKRDQIWVQCFENRVAVSEPKAMSVSNLNEGLLPLPNRVAGSAARLVAAAKSGVQIISELPSPPIAAVARHVALQPPADGKPKPLYLRPPDAKPQTSVARA